MSLSTTAAHNWLQLFTHSIQLSYNLGTVYTNFWSIKMSSSATIHMKICTQVQTAYHVKSPIMQYKWVHAEMLIKQARLSFAYALSACDPALAVWEPFIQP